MTRDPPETDRVHPDPLGFCEKEPWLVGSCFIKDSFTLSENLLQDNLPTYFQECNICVKCCQVGGHQDQPSAMHRSKSSHCPQSVVSLGQAFLVIRVVSVHTPGTAGKQDPCTHHSSYLRPHCSRHPREHSSYCSTHPPDRVSLQQP